MFDFAFLFEVVIDETKCEDDSGFVVNLLKKYTLIPPPLPPACGTGIGV